MNELDLALKIFALFHVPFRLGGWYLSWEGFLLESLSRLVLENLALSLLPHLYLRLTEPLNVPSGWRGLLPPKMGNDSKFQLFECFIYIDYLIFNDALLTKIFRVISTAC